MKPISELGYEEARDELIEVVRRLEQGGLDLDASLKLWERGEELAKRCEVHLAGARRWIEDALSAGDDEKVELSKSGHHDIKEKIELWPGPWVHWLQGDLATATATDRFFDFDIFEREIDVILRVS